MIISYESINRVNPLYFRIIHASRYIEEKNRNKYLVFDSADKNKEVLKKYTEMFGMKLKTKQMTMSVIMKKIT